MAAAIAIRNLLTQMGCTIAAATEIADNQGYDSLDKLKLLNNADVVKLCKVIQQPGGQIPNPAGAAGTMMPDPGVPISLRAKNNIKLLTYYIRHLDQISRKEQAAGITLAKVRALRELKDHKHTYHNPPLEITLQETDWSRNMEVILEHLWATLGGTGIPLAYVVCRTHTVPPAAGDPPDKYKTLQDEMIARAAHLHHLPGAAAGVIANHSTFVIDNRSVWKILANICRDHASWTWIKPHQRSKDGHGAYWALWDHYLGPNNVNNMANAAEHWLQTLSYTGEQQRWNFECLVNEHQRQHQILEGLVQYGYNGIDKGSKVQYLNNSIKTNKLDSVCVMIMADPALQISFSRAVNLYKDFIQQDLEQKVPLLTVAEVGANKDTNPSGPKKIENQYYSQKEYSAMSHKDRYRLKRLREEEGKPSQHDKRQKKIAQMTVAEFMAETTSGLNASAQDNKDGITLANEKGLKGNRDHPLLNRGKQKS